MVQRATGAGGAAGRHELTMGRHQPGLDQNRWMALWSEIGARGDPLPAFLQLAQAYSAPDRSYHNTEHLTHCLSELDQNLELAERAEEVEAALWFHDAVYVPQRADNESESARLAQSLLRDAGVDPEASRRIAALILATRHTAPAAEADARLICDIDLSILGSPRSEFDRFERQIRQEYSWVPADTYRLERSEVLRRFLRRASIYQTAAFYTKYEAPARENLQRLLTILG